MTPEQVEALVAEARDFIRGAVGFECWSSEKQANELIAALTPLIDGMLAETWDEAIEAAGILRGAPVNPYRGATP
jgi:hypothetical protein